MGLSTLPFTIIEVLVLLLLPLLFDGFCTPRMFHNLTNCKTLIDIPVQHRLDQVDARFTHDPRDSELVVHYFINAVEGVLLIDEGVKQDPERPDILFFAAVGFSL